MFLDVSRDEVKGNLQIGFFLHSWNFVKGNTNWLTVARESEIFSHSNVTINQAI